MEEEKKKQKILITIILTFSIILLSSIKISKNIKNKNEHIITKQSKSMKYAYKDLSSICLRNGNVLLIGKNGDYAEIYNANNKKFQLIKLEYPQCLTSMNLLSNNNVIIFGKGIMDYNPDTNLFTTKNMTFFRYEPKTILLSNEKIFIMGGIDPYTHKTIRNCEIYDPIKNTLLYVGDINTANNNNIDLTLLPDGNVLIIGNNFTQLYKIEKNKLFDYKKLNVFNTWHKTFRLKNNKILVFYNSNTDKKYHVGYYDKNKKNIYQISKTDLNLLYSDIILLPNDNLLLIGVALNKYIDYSCKGIYLFNIKNNKFVHIGNMAVDRRRPKGTLLNNNKTVLITGGLSSKGNFDFRTNSTELLFLK